MMKRRSMLLVLLSLCILALMVAAGCSNKAPLGSMARQEAKTPAGGGGAEPSFAGSSAMGGASGSAGHMPGPTKETNGADSASPASESAPSEEVTAAKPPAIGASESADRYLIRNATLTVEAEDARKATDQLIFAVRAARGYVGNLQESVDALGAPSITIEVRVPAQGFDKSMQELAALGKVLDKHVTAEDVTEEFVDTQSTLRNLKRTEGRLLEHLSKTGKLSDTLLVETELTRVRQEIEQNEGRVRFLSHRIAFSTIAVTLREKARTQALVPPESFSTGKQVSDASRSLVEFLRGLWSVVIWIGIWAVVWLPIAVVMLVLVRRERHRPRRTPPSPFTYSRPVPEEPTAS